MSGAIAFIENARQTYLNANEGTLRWLLARPLLGGAFVNSKENSITLADYGPADGLHGPDFTYGWIQGRALEALATHAAYFERSNPALSGQLDAAAHRLYGALKKLVALHGHGYFCYDSAMQPIIAADGDALLPQAQPPEIYTYSDIFFRKGLIAAASRIAPDDLNDHLIAFESIVSAIEGHRFQMNERQVLAVEAIKAEPDDFGPRMILLGAAGMLKRIGRPDIAGFADRFIAAVLERHLDPGTMLLRNVPGEDVCNVGHAIEFVGFALDYLPPDADAALIEKLEQILLASFAIGFNGPGINLTVSIARRAATNAYCPWWSLPETIRSAALAYERTNNPQALAVWEKAHAAFFETYWRGNPAIAFQTMDKDGPVDFVPATPDLDPGYHTGLSLLAAIEVAERMNKTNPAHKPAWE